MNLLVVLNCISAGYNFAVWYQFDYKVNFICGCISAAIAYIAWS